MTVPKLRFPEFRDAGEWEEKKLGEICDCIVPGRDKPKSFTGDIPWITIPDIQGLRIHSSINQLGLSVDEIKECGAKIVPKNSVVMSCVGTFGLISICEQDLVINQQLHAWLPNPKINNYYLAHSLILQKQQMERMATNTTIAYLNKSSCNAVKITIPQLPEQQKIADCLSSIDDRITLETQKLDTLKAHKKGLMQQLFPAEGETLPKLRFPEFQDAGEWVPSTLEHICTAKISYGIVQAGPHIPNGMPYIKSTDLNSKLCLATLDRTSDIIAQKYRRSEVVPGDIVFSLRGNIGVAQIIPKDILVANLTQGTARIRPQGRAEFYLQALRSQPVHNRILAVSKGSTFQEISLEALRKIFLFHPKVEEQEKIADCLTSIDEAIAAQSQAIELLKLHKKGLMQQLFPSVEEAKI